MSTPTPRYLQRAHEELEAADARARRAEVRTELAGRPSLAYAAVNDAKTVYLVAYDGHVIGELRHSANSGALAEWRAWPDEDYLELGPYRTARQAAAALLAQVTPGPADDHRR
jgi:hypothetical protein